MKKIVIGVDIGGTNTAIGYVDINGNVLIKTVISTTKYSDVDDFVAYVAREINNLGETLRKEFDYEIVGIGIGAPCANYFADTIDNPPNLSWEGIIPIISIFRRHFPSIIITLTNDANGAAMGELIYGGAKGITNFITITLGTGVGSGIISDGKLLYGQNSFAGELGHVISVLGGRECACGRRGCLEAYTSANGVRRTAFELLAELKCDSILRSYSYNDITSEIIYKAAVSGDILAKEVFDRTAKTLGIALANACAVVFPEVIFLFGGLANAGDMLLEPTKRYMNENISINYKDKVDLRLSELNCVNATILGASSFVWEEYGNLID